MKARARGPQPPVVRSVELPETATAYWFRCTLADGREITMSVPKR